MSIKVVTVVLPGCRIKRSISCCQNVKCSLDFKSEDQCYVARISSSLLITLIKCRHRLFAVYQKTTKQQQQKLTIMNMKSITHTQADIHTCTKRYKSAQSSILYNQHTCMKLPPVSCSLLSREAATYAV